MAARDRSKPAREPQGTELCTVRRLTGSPIVKGTFLARNGAWERKYVVEYVRYLGIQATGHGTDAHTWAIGVRNLGNFYADGRVYRARSSKIKELVHTQSLTRGGNDLYKEMEITASCYEGLFGYHGGYIAVEPADPPEVPLVLKPCKPPRRPPYVETAEQKAAYEQAVADMQARGFG